jgi:hypothetical protein
MHIDESDEQFEKADCSIRDNLEFDSNVITESFLQSEKHFSQMIVRDEGMQIDDSNEQS